VRAFNPLTQESIADFFAYDPSFLGGVDVAYLATATGGVIITGAGPGGGPHVQLFDPATQSAIQSFFAYDTSFNGGVNVTSADIDGDGVFEIVVAPATGLGDINIFSSRTGELLGVLRGVGTDNVTTINSPQELLNLGTNPNLSVTTPSSNGLRVTGIDPNRDGRESLLIATGPTENLLTSPLALSQFETDVNNGLLFNTVTVNSLSSSSTVEIYNPLSGEIEDEITPFGPGDMLGAFVG